MKIFKAWQAVVALTAFLVFYHLMVAPVPAAEPAPAERRPVRLAILESSRGLVKPAEREARAVMLDLLTARLSVTAGFELVERSALDAIFRELALSAANLSKPSAAVQVGRLVKADWFLLVNFPEGTTNAVLGKILDAATGVIRDLQVVPWKPSDVTETTEALTAFVTGSRNPTAGLGGRMWIGFGAFEDLGLYRRYPDFGERLRTAMALKYAGTKVSVVERSQVQPLLEELRMSMAGFTEVRTNRDSAQPAFVLVDGLYQAFQSEQSLINLVLRMEWIGGRKSAVTIKEPPGAPLEAKVAESIDRFLAKSPTAVVTNSPTRAAEARAQLSRARDLARFRTGYVIPFQGLSVWSVLPPDRAPRVRDAISALENALFLDPENLEAKFCLAGCLMDPLINQVEKARDLWREVAGLSTNAPAVIAARTALAGSYVERDNAQAWELFMVLRNTTTNLAERAAFSTSLQNVLRPLARADKLAPKDILAFAVDHWRMQCRLAELRVAAGKTIDANTAFVNPILNFHEAFVEKSRPQEERAHVGMVVSNLVHEFPQLEPYLVGTYVQHHLALPFWNEWYQRTLQACEEHPEKIPDPASYYSSYLLQDLRSFVVQKNFLPADQELADRMVRLLEKHGRNYMKPQLSLDEVDFLIGRLHAKLSRWTEAIASFDACRRATSQDGGAVRRGLGQGRQFHLRGTRGGDLPGTDATGSGAKIRPFDTDEGLIHRPAPVAIARHGAAGD